MAVRRTWPVLGVLSILGCLWLGCAESTRYRVLTFFFEGVPKPGQAAPSEDTPLDPTPGAEDAQVAAADPAKSRYGEPGTVRMHPPYWDGRCGVCHVPQGGLAKRTPQEGLCASCHDAPGDVRYAHGPVVVNDCLFCHHHHGGEYPYMLRSEANLLCLRCHQREDLTAGEGHARIDELACTDCHHGHGGDDRFFLKRDRP